MVIPWQLCRTIGPLFKHDQLTNIFQCEAIPESLKNMLLVMHTAGILQSSEAEQSQLWKLTWDRIDTFLPKLRSEVFKPHTIGERNCAFKIPALSWGVLQALGMLSLFQASEK